MMKRDGLRKCPLDCCPFRELTPYQMRVLKMLVIEGLTTSEAAKKYNLKVDGVRDVGSVILEKTGSKRLAQAVYKLMKAGKVSSLLRALKKHQ